MDLPKRSQNLDEARDNLHERYAKIEAHVLNEIDELARAGFSDKRWCAIARTRIEEGFLALHRALRDYPGDDPNEYGKTHLSTPLPREFAPKPEPAPRSHLDPGQQLERPRPEIQDYRADGGLSDPK